MPDFASVNRITLKEVETQTDLTARDFVPKIGKTLPKNSPTKLKNLESESAVKIPTKRKINEKSYAENTKLRIEEKIFKSIKSRVKMETIETLNQDIQRESLSDSSDKESLQEADLKMPPEEFQDYETDCMNEKVAVQAENPIKIEVCMQVENTSSTLNKNNSLQLTWNNENPSSICEISVSNRIKNSNNYARFIQIAGRIFDLEHLEVERQSIQNHGKLNHIYEGKTMYRYKCPMFAGSENWHIFASDIVRRRYNFARFGFSNIVVVFQNLLHLPD